MSYSKMLSLLDLSTLQPQSVSLEGSSTCNQVLVAIGKRLVVGQNNNNKLTDPQQHYSHEYFLYALRTDEEDNNNCVLAHRLRSEDKPLHVLKQLKRINKEAPSFTVYSHPTPQTKSTRFLLVRTKEEREDGVFLCTGEGVATSIKLDLRDSPFFQTVSKLEEDGVCGYVLLDSVKQWLAIVDDFIEVRANHNAFDVKKVSLANVSLVYLNNTTIEIHTPLHTYRLQSDPVDRWFQKLNSRSISATDNELMNIANMIIADEEYNRARAVEEALKKFRHFVFTSESLSESFEECFEAPLIEYARSIDCEYLFLWYLDSKNLTNGDEGQITGMIERAYRHLNKPRNPFQQQVGEEETGFPLLSKYDEYEHVLNLVKQELFQRMFLPLKTNETMLQKIILMALV